MAALVEPWTAKYNAVRLRRHTRYGVESAGMAEAEAQGRMLAMELKKGICGVCPAGCWVEVELDDGRLTDIRADPGHALGMMCRRGQHAPEIVYSEHRLRYPMKRVGPKGSHDFERITWDEAYSTIARHLNAIKDESGPEAVSIYTGRGAFELSLCDMYQPRGVTVSSASNVLFPFGSPNTMGVGALCYVSYAMIAPHVTMGRMLRDMFADIENAELLVVWGANPATDSPPLDMHRLQAAAKRGARVVVIDPRRTETVARTGAEWIPVRPGTDCALALGMISVLIDEELYDDEFAREWCHGFDELCTYVQHFTPEVVESITGVPVTRVVSLAREISGVTGACPVMYTGLEYSNSGIQAIRAVLTMFSLAGHLDAPGGIGLAMRGTHFPINHSTNLANPDVHRAVARDRFPIYTQYREESHATGLVDAVLHGEPYRIRGLIIHGASLLTSWPEAPVWRETLSRLDFLVCIDRQLTADAAYADIVLPATTMFEIDSYMVYGPIFRIREKLVEPVGEARNDYLIMAELAKWLGYGELFPQSEEEMVRHALDGSGYTLEEVRQAGGSVRLPTPLMQYRKWEKGGLRPDGLPGFDTPTGKFEIYATILEESGYEPLPKYTEPVEGPLSRPDLMGRFPLVFNSGARPQTDFRSQHHGIPGLVAEHPEPSVQMNVEDAAQRGIDDGDLVEVSTSRGSVRFRARVNEDMMRGAVECSMGGGTAVGPKAWRERNVNLLTDLANYDEISGFPVFKALLCQVTRLEAGADRATSSAEAGTAGAAGTAGTIGAAGKGRPAPGWQPAMGRSPEPRRRIYLDNNATTRVADAVREAMLPFLDHRHGNPSSIHGAGRDARDGLETARRQVAELIGCRPRRLVFTGGGSESINLALKGIAFARRGHGTHIVTSRVEHPAGLKACAFLDRLGYDVTYLDVDETGLVSSDALEAALRDDTILVSVMMANNEVGTVQPVRELCRIAHARGVLFHTDAVQAVGKIPVDVVQLDVDLLSLSGHKFHGPKGVGALYRKPDITLEPLVHGGRQEGGTRAGTENVPAIVGLGKAAELAMRAAGDGSALRALRDRLEAGVRELVPAAALNGHSRERLPTTLNLTLPGIRGESLVVAMDRHGVSLSSGSACKSGSPDPTHVLLAMGQSEADAHCSVRFSLSRFTTDEDVSDTLSALAQVLEEIETTIRFLPCR